MPTKPFYTCVGTGLGVRGGRGVRGVGKVWMLQTKANLPQASAALGQLGEAGGVVSQGSTHTLLLVTRAPNQPFQ